MPLINSRVRKSYNHRPSVFKFLAAGVGSNYFTYPITLFSNNSFGISKFLEGKTYFGRFLVSISRKLLVFYTDFSRHFFNAAFIRAFAPSFINLHSSITSLTNKHIGVLNKPASNLYDSFSYSIGLNATTFFTPTVYQGTHGTSLSTNSVLVLPTTIFTEKTSSYLNLEGTIQRSYTATTPDKLVRHDSEVLDALFDFWRNFYFVNFISLAKYGVLLYSRGLLPF